MFSVVIPLYNKELSIGNTIQSVLDQTYQEFEIVVVNDGSTDNSLQIVEQINDPRIRIINKLNGGVSSARNRGIKEAKYEWIAFLDADDLWEKEKLFEVSKAIKANPDIAWVIHGYKTVSRFRVVRYIYHKNGIIENIIDELINGLKIQTSTVTVKRNLFFDDPRLYFREGLNNSEDREVWYKLSILFPQPVYINKTLSSYIIDYSGTSLTRLQSKKQNVFPFLDMQKRLQEVINETSKPNEKKITKFIQIYNQNAILGNWINLKEFPDIFAEHLQPNFFRFLKQTVKLPRILKILFIKIYFILS